MGFTLYHLVPDDMQGSILHPLNVIRENYPAVYTVKVAKYKGREWLQERVIPHLNCLWNDVLFFCPVHPGKIIGKLRAIGYDYPPEKFFALNTDLLEQDKIVVQTFPGNGLGPQYHRQSPESIPGIDELPRATAEYFEESFVNKTRFLLFAYIPHVLYMGSIDISNCQVIEV